MARIAGVDIPRDKRLEIALRYIFGIGPSNARKIIAETGLSPDLRVKDLKDSDVAKLRNVIDQRAKVEGELRTEVSMNIKRLIDIGSYRGMRHRRGLPVRGQRTRTNARTRKGGKNKVNIRRAVRPAGSQSAAPAAAQAASVAPKPSGKAPKA